MTMLGFKDQVIDDFMDAVEPREEEEDVKLWALCTLDIFRPAFISNYFKIGDTEPLVQVLLHLYKFDGLFTRYGAFRDKYISFKYKRVELE